MNRIKLILVLTVCVIVTTFLVFLFVNNAELEQEKSQQLQKRDVKEENKIDLDDVLNGRFRYETLYPTWTTGKYYISRKRDGSFYRVDIEAIEDEHLILGKDSWANATKPFSWSMSADEMYLAIFYNQTDGYAHYVRTFSVDIWDLTDQKLVKVDILSDSVQKFKWSPCGHNYTFVRQFNVYINEDLSSYTQITFDGDEKLLFNGISDWLYTVEITDDDALLWWSPDCSYLAYATIDQKNVSLFEFTVFNNFQYPKLVELPYPKPSTPIPRIRLSIYSFQTTNVTQLAPKISTSWNGDYYLNSVVWRGNILTPTWKSRYQSEAIVESCAAPYFNCAHGDETTYSSTTGWLGTYKVSHTYPLDNQDEFIIVQSHNGFPHIAVHNATADSVDMRTSGNFEVTDTGYGYESIYHYDHEHDWIYYTSTEFPDQPGEGLPRIRHMWRVKGHGENVTRSCVTCTLNILYPGKCNWVTPSFNHNGSFVVVNCGGTRNDVPITTVHKLNEDGDYDFVRVAVTNDDLKADLEGFDFRSVEFGTLKLPNMNEDWYYMLLKPPNFNPQRNYSLLVQVYSGPGFQEVQDRFSVSWKDYIASSEDVVVMSFDGRGTGFRGEDILHKVYKKLGEYEPLDQIEAARYIGDEMEYIDKTKTAIWGRSYGGYATSRTIGEDSDNVFRCGFAVAPVTHWELYHTIYTERYMWQPHDNQGGYAKSTTLQKAENFKKHRFSIIHGTRDENVHFQNAAHLSKYLIANDVDFKAYFAADDDHGFTRVTNGYNSHYRLLTRLLKSCFE